jgi:hypothetical protein
MIVIHSRARSGGQFGLLPPRTITKISNGPPNVTMESALKAM